MCIINNVKDADDAFDFLVKYGRARDAMRAASAAMLKCRRTAVVGPARENYDRAHKKMVQLIRQWNAIEHTREVKGGDVRLMGCIEFQNVEAAPPTSRPYDLLDVHREFNELLREQIQPKIVPPLVPPDPSNWGTVMEVCVCDAAIPTPQGFLRRIFWPAVCWLLVVGGVLGAIAMVLSRS